MRYKLSHCLLAMLFLALVGALAAKHYRAQAEIASLRQSLDLRRDILQSMEYGAANLRLLRLNPAIWEDKDCAQFLHHELALAILEHWQDQHAMGEIAGNPAHALEFTAEALLFLECTNADEFAVLSKTKLTLYPDDHLAHAVWELTEQELESLDTFIRSAVSMNAAEH